MSAPTPIQNGADPMDIGVTTAAARVDAISRPTAIAYGLATLGLAVIGLGGLFLLVIQLPHGG